MFGIFSGVKMALIGGVIAVAVGGFIYVKGLQADLSTAKANNLILTESVAVSYTHLTLPTNREV